MLVAKGMVLQYSGDDAPRRDWPVPMSSDAFRFYDQLIKFAESVPGIQEFTQGRKPTGVTSGDAIETLQEASQTRIRLKDRNNETSLKRMGKQVISRMMQFYRETRVFRMTGKEGWPEFFEFFIEESEDGLVINKQPFQAMFKKGQKEPSEFIPDTENQFTSEPTKGIFDIKVISGTSLPFQKEKRESRSFKLFDLGLYSKKKLLETIEDPNPQQTIQDREEEQIKEAEQAATLPQPPEQGAPA